ncbi:unnamed protein product [Mytilus coruscus]|uniref:Endonuclease/exonuclease/phosphatase domain-containing protein n=1 Tax=Mytilus coruscus TaxID=42192 RepID=A0A6J8BSC5_MYTCO|nr:unnamed protein product [Mytilus coruscus]
MINDKFGDASDIFLCDNSNLSFRGQPASGILVNDGIHLTKKGTYILSGNLKQAIGHILDLRGDRLEMGGNIGVQNQNWYTSGGHKNLDILSNLSEEIATYQDKGQVMILGDFNARTGNLEDFISNNDDDYNDYVPVPEEYKSDEIKQSRLSNDNKSCSRVQVNCLKENLDNFPMKFKWETMSPELFLNALKSDEIKVKIQDFENIQNQSQSEVDAALHSLHDILKMAANKSLNFFKFRKLYGKKCKLQCRQYKLDIIQKLDNLFEKNPSNYWELLNKLKYEDENKLSSNSTISADEWFKHFQELNTVSSKYQSKILEFKNILCTLEQRKTFSELDYKITEKEVTKAMHALKMINLLD